MLELRNVCLAIDREGEPFDLIHGANLTVPPGHFMAIVGPSGCGKTTLLKIIAGLTQQTDGSVLWDGRDLAEEEDLDPAEIGYVPQFSIAFDHLTVEESVESTVRLRVRTDRPDGVYDLADQVLAETGLDAIRGSLVKVLSGGQKRRLGLALELVSNPLLLLCDEVTSGLDPKSEREIVDLMHRLSLQSRRIVVSVTHSLSNLELYDSVLVMFEGRVVYHGPPRALNHYFSVESAEDIYPRLGQRPAERWFDSWSRHRESYYEAFADSTGMPAAASSALLVETRPAEPAPEPEDAPPPARPVAGEAAATGMARTEEAIGHHGSAVTPGAFAQFLVLVGRRWKLFVRDRTQLLLHLAILLGFPILVVIFALEGIEPMPQRADFSSVRSAQDFVKQTEVVEKQVELGALVSGLVMFQVILLTLMGSNNSAREIAAERLIFEKEKFAGLRPASYLTSKLAFLAVLVVAQSAWMAVFVNVFTKLPGDFGQQLTLLIMANAAMTSVCLGISSLMKSPEQASLLSVYLVGFQLPLSGAVLALPGAIEAATRPFIAAYWAWAGQLQSMKASDYFVGIKEAVATSIEISPSAAAFVLACHVVIGVGLAYIGTTKNRWE